MDPDKTIDCSDVRPRGKPISTGEPTGTVPFLRIIDAIAETILPSSGYRHATRLEQRTREEIRELLEAGHDNRSDR